jgi:hypothetical protein
MMFLVTFCKEASFIGASSSHQAGGYVITGIVTREVKLIFQFSLAIIDQSP